MSFSAESNCDLPLCVDLDGTLIQQDVTLLSLKQLALDNLWYCYKIFFWFLQGGKSNVKFKLASFYPLKKAQITLNPEFYEFLYQQKRQGRILILATGATLAYAQTITTFYPFFTGVVASSAHFNCVGAHKAQILVQKYGFKGFDYAGNSHQDIDVWQACREPIGVNCSLALREKICTMFGKSLMFFDSPDQ